MSLVLVAVPVIPVVAAVVAQMLRPGPAARLVTVASALAAAAAAVLVVAVAVDDRIDAVISDDGRAVVGLTADRVGAVLALLTTFVGLVVQSFAARSLRGDPRARRFHALAALLVAATSVVALGATATTVVVAWIVTSVTLVALLAHKAPWRRAVEATRRTSWAFATGDLAFVVAVAVSLIALGDLDLRAVEADAAALGQETIVGVDAVEVVAILLVVAGVARSALIPLHRWLPATLAAPTPVSALLHAGVVNGAGVLLIRFAPVYGASTAAMSLAFVLGAITAFVATAVMLVRSDVKGGLVWSTSGQMGFMVVQLGVGAFAAALFHIVGHALYKATLFLGAGGAISSHARQVQRPHLGRADTALLTSPLTRAVMGLVVPLVAFAAALLVVDPHLTSAATILVVAFGVLSLGRAVNGWLSATPLGAGRSLGLAAAGAVVGAFAYTAGLALFEGFVVDVVPYDPPAAVGPVWVAAVLMALGLVVVSVAAVPGPRGATLRRHAYGWLLSTGAPPRRPEPAPRPPVATTPAAQPVSGVGQPLTAGDIA